MALHRNRTHDHEVSCFIVGSAKPSIRLVFVAMLISLLQLSAIAGEKSLDNGKRVAQLTKALAGADRMEILNPRQKRVLHQIKGAEKMSGFLELVRVDEKGSGFHCACGGDFLMAFYSGEKMLGVVGYHHNSSLRWRSRSWKGDGLLTTGSSKALIKWFEQNGFSYPRDQQRSRQREQKKNEIKEKRFTQCFISKAQKYLSMPKDQKLEHDAQVKVQAEKLHKAYSSQVDLCRDVFRAFGTRPTPKLHYGFADQIGEAALVMVNQGTRDKLLLEVKNFSPEECSGACFQMVRSGFFKQPWTNAQRGQLVKLLEGALRANNEPHDVKNWLLWYARQGLDGVSEIVRPYATGELKFKLHKGQPLQKNQPSVRSISVLVSALLGDARVKATAEKLLGQNTNVSASRSTYAIAMAHFDKNSKLVQTADVKWETPFLYRAAFDLADVDACVHSYNLVLNGPWVSREAAVLKFQALTGQKWYQGHEHERPDWYHKTARDWWAKNKMTFKFPVK